MADWTDGAQYAPRERPFGFAMPEADPLVPAPAEAHPSDGRPATPPSTWGRPEARPLAELVPVVAHPRDPSEPFPAEQSSTGAWGSAHRHWEPTMPLVDVTEPLAAPSAALPSTAGGPAFPPPMGAPVATPPAPPATAGMPGAHTAGWPAAGTGFPAPTPGVDPALAALPAPTGQPVAFPPPPGADVAIATPAPVQTGQPSLPYPPPVAGDPYAASPTTAGDPCAARPPAGVTTQTPLSQFPPPTLPGDAPRPVAHRAQPPAPAPSGYLPALVGGLGPVMLGALAFGAAVPLFSVIGYIVASWLARRARIGQHAINVAHQAATLVFFVVMVGNWLVPSLPDLAVVCRWLCIALLVTSLVAGHLDLTGRRR